MKKFFIVVVLFLIVVFQSYAQTYLEEVFIKAISFLDGGVPNGFEKQRESVYILVHRNGVSSVQTLNGRVVMSSEFFAGPNGTLVNAVFDYLEDNGWIPQGKNNNIYGPDKNSIMIWKRKDLYACIYLDVMLRVDFGKNIDFLLNNQ